jgi:hypothetical protein
MLRKYGGLRLLGDREAAIPDDAQAHLQSVGSDESPSPALQAVLQAIESLSTREQEIIRVTWQYYTPGQQQQRLPHDVVAQLARDFKTSPENIRKIRERAPCARSQRCSYLRLIALWRKPNHDEEADNAAEGTKSRARALTRRRAPCAAQRSRCYSVTVPPGMFSGSYRVETEVTPIFLSDLSRYRHVVPVPVQDALADRAVQRLPNVQRTDVAQVFAHASQPRVAAFRQAPYPETEPMTYAEMITHSGMTAEAQHFWRTLGEQEAE